jgi:hypothetical protein
MSLLRLLTNPTNVKHYEALGYTFPKYKNVCYKWVTPNGTKILVRSKDLAKNSKIKVSVLCPLCSQIRKIPFCSLSINKSDMCHRCAAGINGKKLIDANRGDMRGDKSPNWRGGKGSVIENIRSQLTGSKIGVTSKKTTTLVKNVGIIKG